MRALDLITVVVPPALPATLSIGTSFSLGRLRKLGIFCISPSRVNVGGKVNVCCFDKTGTLTEDGLDILGVRSLDRGGQMFGELLDDIDDMPLAKDKANFLHAMTTCHSLKMVDGEAIGDPLDMKMFSFTNWTLEEGRISGTGVIKSKTGTEQTALVQTVVRPPGSAQFRLEDALKGATKVGIHLNTSPLLTRCPKACTLPGTRGDSNFRVCFGIAAHERYRQEVEEQQHGGLRQRCTRGYERYLRKGFLYVSQ